MDIVFIVDLGVLAIFFILVLFGGGFMLEKLVAAIYGPFKIVGIILAIIYIGVGFLRCFFDKESESGRASRIVGGILSGIGNALRGIMSITFLLSVMLGFLINMRSGGVAETLFAILNVIGDSSIVLILLAASFGIDKLFTMLTYLKMPMFAIGIITLILSYIHFWLSQALLVGFYGRAVEELFKSYPAVSDFILHFKLW